MKLLGNLLNEKNKTAHNNCRYDMLDSIYVYSFYFFYVD